VDLAVLAIGPFTRIYGSSTISAADTSLDCGAMRASLGVLSVYSGRIDFVAAGGARLFSAPSLLTATAGARQSFGTSRSRSGVGSRERHRHPAPLPEAARRRHVQQHLPEGRGAGADHAGAGLASPVSAP